MAPSTERPGAPPPGARALSTDQAIVLACLLALTGLAWLYLLRFSASMTPQASAAAGGMAAMAMSAPAPPTAAAYPLIAAMWAVMMVGMMAPSAVPMILVFTAIRRQRVGSPLLATAVFTSGYLVVWTIFAMAAAALQLELSRLAAVTPMMILSSRVVAAFLLIGAGVYEFTPLKEACLSNCQGPMTFIATRWRPGLLGGFVMGAQHGLYCLGCCWALMLLLFVGGVMNLIWVAALAAIVLVQKVAPRGLPVASLTGLTAIVAGLFLLVRFAI